MMWLAIVLALNASPQPKVTLDVKDGKVREVLKSVQKQCGIKNLIVDPEVPEGSATFYLKDVPCPAALDTVLKTYRLKSVTYSNSLAAVEPIH